MPKRFVLLAMAFVLGGFAVSGCSDSDPDPAPQPTARIRLVHAAPDAGPVDIYFGDSATPWLGDLAYGGAANYDSGSPRTVTLVFRAAGADPGSDPVFSSDPIELVSGASVTVVAGGLTQSAADDDKFRLLVFDDNFQNTPQASVRTVHAGSDAPDATVIIGATAQILANNLARWEESGRSGVLYEAGVVQDIAVLAGGGITSFRVPGLDASASYYFILTGLITGQGAQTAPFTLLIVGPGGGVERETFDPRDFRLVHTVPDFGLVDTYAIQGLGDSFNRVQLKDSLAFGDATDYTEASIRQVIIEMYGVGADPDQDKPLYSQSVHIADAANSTTVFAAGLWASQGADDAIGFFSLADDFPVPDMGLTTARLVHACPNLNDLTVDFGDDGSIEARMARFAGNEEGAILLASGTGQTMAVGEESATVDVFTTPALAADKEHYLVLTGIKNGSPGFVLLTVSQDGSLGFTDPD